ncbi:F-box/LRR-repeat protein At4g14103-like [Cynara cardunculus var. scolymus]|uniref:F-box/LRR-repeat protein At4g14103-like n=1 Tax=Cynara cardunculus var. scolymus TaxID=59895 RepID=UPI000D62C3EA|nr:F-box/LRR-repeat protein At4g14103-like [Cynara cardunculus var. scolymus]
MSNIEIQRTCDWIDVISQLPDCILHHILSFIPTKDVVKTSILSKRWNNLWTSVPNLDFDDALLYASEMDGRDPPEVACFMNFVERVLLLRDASNMEKFRLSCRVCFNASRIHSWISAAIMHNVHELDLCLFAEDPSVLPRSMFSSVSLTILKIEMNCILELPNSVCLPYLKILHLSLVTFMDDESTQKLFSGCRILEELVMLDCEWMNLKNITISSLTLKRLTIDDLPYFGPPDAPRGCTIEINTPNLAYLKYTGYLSNEIFLYDVSSLVKAYISVPIPNERQKEVVFHVVGLLIGLRNVVTLRVSNCTIESLVLAGNMLVHLPVFLNLDRLELSMEIGNPTVGSLMKLLNCCPNLRSLCITEGFGHDVCLDENDLILSWLPKCMSSRLKTLVIGNFHGHDSEIRFLKCFLQRGLVSEKVDICCCENLLGDPSRRKAVKKELEMIARGSSSCVVTFS